MKSNWIYVVRLIGIDVPSLSVGKQLGGCLWERPRLEEDEEIQRGRHGELEPRLLGHGRVPARLLFKPGGRTDTHPPRVRRTSGGRGPGGSRNRGQEGGTTDLKKKPGICPPPIIVGPGQVQPQGPLQMGVSVQFGPNSLGALSPPPPCRQVNATLMARSQASVSGIKMGNGEK